MSNAAQMFRRGRIQKNALGRASWFIEGIFSSSFLSRLPTQIEPAPNWAVTYGLAIRPETLLPSSPRVCCFLTLLRSKKLENKGDEAIRRIDHRSITNDIEKG